MYDNCSKVGESLKNIFHHVFFIIIISGEKNIIPFVLSQFELLNLKVELIKIFKECDHFHQEMRLFLLYMYMINQLCNATRCQNFTVPAPLAEMSNHLLCLTSAQGPG